MTTETLLEQNTLDWPYPFYQQLRTEAPVFYDTILGAWLVTRYEDLQQAAALDPTLSSFMGYTQGIAPPWQKEMEEMMWREGYGPNNLADSVKVDPPLLARRRSLVNQALTAEKLAPLEPAILEMAGDLLTKLSQCNEADLLTRFSTPLPIMAMCKLMNFPTDRLDEMSSWADSIAASVAVGIDKDTAMKHARNICELQKFVVSTIVARRKAPGTDLISQMITARVEGDEKPQLDDKELLAMGIALIAGGLDTTRNGIAWGVFNLATQPQLFQALKRSDHQDILLNKFIDESLRTQTIVSHVPRYAQTDVEIGGVTVPKGSTVFLCWGSGNYDENIFPEAHQFDLERKNARRHLTFGSGIHFCAGFRLARLEMKCAFKAVLQHFDSLELKCKPEDLPIDASMALRGPGALPVRFTLAN